jgi:hypothetical protein
MSLFARIRNFFMGGSRRRRYGSYAAVGGPFAFFLGRFVRNRRRNRLAARDAGPGYAPPTGY